MAGSSPRLSGDGHDESSIEVRGESPTALRANRANPCQNQNRMLSISSSLDPNRVTGEGEIQRLLDDLN
jgi:hypothetical protein